MAKIAFLLMVHENPEQVIRQARALVAHGDCVAIHVDLNAGPQVSRAIRSALGDTPRVTFAKPVRGGWGTWSLVQATLNLIAAARTAFDGVTHYFLLSGGCYPTKSRGYLDRYLDDDTDIIEAHDFRTTRWIRTGLTDERFTRRHWFNERTQQTWFYRSLKAQRAMGLSRKPPRGIRLCIGSQWWCLRAETVERLVAFLAQRRDVIRFFRTVWIPDESFFQTLVSHLVPGPAIRCHPPTTLLFSDYGKPVVFHDEHRGFLQSQNAPFARKISANARGLQDQLLARFAQQDADGPEGGAGPGLYAHLAARGRIGRRTPQRFWERAIAPRADGELLLLAAPRRALSRHLSTQIARILRLADLGFVFDDEAPLPVAIGNLERGLFKRDRHRHAFLGLLFQATGSNRLLVCVDPARIETIHDLARAVDGTRLLVLDRPPTEATLAHEAAQSGLLSPASGAFEQDEIRRTLGAELTLDTGALRNAVGGRIFHNRIDRSRHDNATEIGHFLQVRRPVAEAIAREAEKLTP